MWDDEEYGGLYGEPSEVDIIIQEARDKLDALLKDSVRTSMAEAKEAETRLAGLKNEISAAEFRLSKLKTEIAGKEAEIEALDLHKIPYKVAEKIVKGLTDGVVRGDEVWVVGAKSEHVDCQFCGGRGKVKMEGKDRFLDCPECHGSGGHYIEHYIPSKVTVDDATVCMELTHYGEVNVQEYAISVSFGEFGRSRYRIGEFFKTEEACQAECDKRNAQKGKN